MKATFLLIKKLLKRCFDEFFTLPHAVHCALHSVEKREILSQWKKISSNQIFSNFFSKTITFTNILRTKCEREFLQFPHHTVGIARNLSHHSVEIMEIYFHTCEINVSTKEITKKLIWRNIFSMRVNFAFSHTLCSPADFSVKLIFRKKQKTLFTKCSFSHMIRSLWMTFTKCKL